MNETLIHIDKAGRVILPKSLRDELAIKPGDLLTLSIQGDHLTLRPNRERVGFIRRGEALVFSTGGADLLDNETVENIRASERGYPTADIANGLPHQERK